MLHEFAELERYEFPWPRMGGLIEKPWVDCEKLNYKREVFERISMSAVPAGSQVLDIKFDYKTKIDGTRRARAVVRGDQVFPPPKPGDKFAPCPSWDGIRMFFSRMYPNKKSYENQAEARAEGVPA